MLVLDENLPAGQQYCVSAGFDSGHRGGRGAAGHYG